MMLATEPDLAESVILKPADYDRWLDRKTEQPPIDLLRPYPADEMTAHLANPAAGKRRQQWP